MMIQHFKRLHVIYKQTNGIVFWPIRTQFDCSIFEFFSIKLALLFNWRTEQSCNQSEIGAFFNLINGIYSLWIAVIILRYLSSSYNASFPSWRTWLRQGSTHDRWVYSVISARYIKLYSAFLTIPILTFLLS